MKRPEPERPEPDIRNMKLLYRDDLRAYDAAFGQEEYNEFMGYNGIIRALRDKEELSQLIAEEKESDPRADLVNLLDKFTETGE